VHEFPVITQKFISNLASIKSYLHKNTGVGLIYHLPQTFCKGIAEKNGIVLFALKKYFRHKRVKVFLTPTNLRQDQISEIWVKKANLATLTINFFFEQ